MRQGAPSRPLILVASRDLTQASRRCAELSLAGWRTIHAEELMDTLAAIRGRGPSLVLAMLPMNDLPGADLPGILREIDSNTHLPVVVQIERAWEHERCEYLLHGADDVISAATSGEELVARVRALLRVKELADQLAASRGALLKSLERERKLMAKLRRDNANLQELCTTDPLTRVQNVRSFRDILDHEFRMAVRYVQPLSLLMLDVDHFKLVNDRHGHPTGDYVLKELAVILKRSVRESDVVARTGGEEFSVILPRADLRRCAVLASRVRREVAAHPFAAYGQELRITISIGSASYPADAEITEARMLVYLADQALLTAKETGRDRVVALHELEPPVRRRLRRQYVEARHAEEESPCSPTFPDAGRNSPSWT